MKKKITAEWVMPNIYSKEDYIVKKDGLDWIAEKRAWIKRNWFYIRDKDLDSDIGQKTGYPRIRKLRFLGFCLDSYSFWVWDDKEVFGF